MYAGITNKKNRKHKSKKVVSGKCIFPFKYKRTKYNECINTGNGPWCPTSLTKSGTVDTWGYCIEPDIKKKKSLIKHNNKSVPITSSIYNKKLKKLFIKRTNNSIPIMIS